MQEAGDRRQKERNGTTESVGPDGLGELVGAIILRIRKSPEGKKLLMIIPLVILLCSTFSCQDKEALAGVYR